MTPVVALEAISELNSNDGMGETANTTMHTAVISVTPM